jgi:hypothetical protein
MIRRQWRIVRSNLGCVAQTASSLDPQRAQTRPRCLR